MQHSSFSSKGKEIPSCLHGGLGLEVYPYLLEEALIWDPSLCGSLREDPLCKRPWFLPKLLWTCSINKGEYWPSLPSSQRTNIGDTWRVVALGSNGFYVVKTWSLPNKMKSERKIRNTLSLQHISLLYNQHSTKNQTWVFETESKAVIKHNSNGKLTHGVLWATFLSVFLSKSLCPHITQLFQHIIPFSHQMLDPSGLRITIFPAPCLHSWHRQIST